MNRDDAMQAIDQIVSACGALRDIVANPGEAWHRKGYDFEKRFASMCESRGLSYLRAGRGHFDYVVNGLRVQCKCLVPDSSGMVYVQPGSGPAYEPGSFDVLVVETPLGLHIVQEAEIPRTRSSGLLRAALSADFLKKFSDAWWVLERAESPAGFERQLLLGISAKGAVNGG